MKILGHEISAEQEAAALAVMGDQFRARDVEDAFLKAGVPGKRSVAMRAADRILQRERKKGLIFAMRGGLWTKPQDEAAA